MANTESSINKTKATKWYPAKPIEKKNSVETIITVLKQNAKTKDFDLKGLFNIGISKEQIKPLYYKYYIKKGNNKLFPLRIHYELELCQLSINLRRQHCFRHCTYNFVYDFTTFEYQQSWDATDTIFSCYAWVFIYI